MTLTQESRRDLALRTDTERKITTGKRGRGTVWFLAPFFVLFAAFMIAPICYAAWLSLFHEQRSGLGFGGVETVFVGLDNYAHALGDEAFRRSFATVTAYCVIYIPVMIGGALLLALLLDSVYARAKRLFQLALFLPHAVPGLIAAIIWVFLYNPELSPVVAALRSVGVEWNFIAPGNALTSIVNIVVWEWIGYNMVIFFAALQAIPREMHEAATVDGAGAIRTAVRVKLPMIRGAVVLAALFTAIGALQLFTEPQLLHRAGGGVTGDWTPNMYAFVAASARQDYGVAAASALILAVFAGALSYVITRFTSGRSTA